MEDEGEAEEVEEVGKGRKKGREEIKEKRSMTMTMMTLPAKFQKENQHPKKGRVSAYNRTAL